MQGNHERFLQIQDAFNKLQNDLDAKSSENKERNIIIEELKLEIEKLTNDVIDKTKVSRIVAKEDFHANCINFLGCENFKPAPLRRKKNSSRRNQKQLRVWWNIGPVSASNPRSC